MSRGGLAASFAPSPRRLAWLGLAAFLVAIALVAQLGSVPPAWYPECPSHSLTRLHCPGCGAARAIHAIADGNWSLALQHNLLVVVFAPVLGLWAAQAYWRGVRFNQPALALPFGTARVVLWLVVAFAVLRNLPWWPFSWLAPGP